MEAYYIMNRDVAAAEYINGDLKILDKQLLPLYLISHSFNAWVEKRAIDATRPHSRLLKRMLRLSKTDDFSTALQNNAATITDTYWVKPQNSDLSYADVAFNDDRWCIVALRGSKDGFDIPAGRTPELTNIGSFEKGWKLEHENWWLHKKATSGALFSELFMYKLGKHFGYDMAKYERVSGDEIKSLDFTNNGEVNLEDASGFLSAECELDFIRAYNELKELKGGLEQGYAKMLFMDAICYNPDRHLENFGILRDPASGEILSFAPMFDHNMALISDGVIRDKPISGFLRFYTEFFNDPAIDFTPPILKKADLRRIVDSIDVDIPEYEKQAVISFVYTGYLQIEAIWEKDIPKPPQRDMGFER